MSVSGLSLSKQALLLLFVGTLIRVPALVSPISEGYRNAQTATLTARMIESGQLRLDPIAPWRGDLDARLAMELPIYNLAALAINALPGIRLDAAGRLTSLIFWILSFLALQALWRRTLPPKAAFWANLLFIFAPMNWYLSTAFMPESLLQLLAICFMVCVLDYARKGTWSAFAGLFTTALLGLLVKFPSFVHLGLFAGLVLIDRQGWRSLFRPALIFAGLVIVLCLFAWGEYVKVVNEPHFAEWAGWENVVGFIRPQASRLALSYWLPFVAYNTAFITTLFAIPFIGLGLWKVWETRRQRFRSRVWVYLLVSLFLSWLLWGKGAPAQNYYNLPNLVVFCALFATGIRCCGKLVLSRQWPGQIVRSGGLAISLLLASGGLLGWIYLSQPDDSTVEAAKWANANLAPGASIVYQPRHAPAVMDYPHQPLLSHLTGRRTQVIVRTTAPEELHEALQKGRVVIVTSPAGSLSWSRTLRRLFKGDAPPAPESLLESGRNTFEILQNNDTFTAAIVTN